MLGARTRLSPRLLPWGYLLCIIFLSLNNCCRAYDSNSYFRKITKISACVLSNGGAKNSACTCVSSGRPAVMCLRSPSNIKQIPKDIYPKTKYLVIRNARIPEIFEDDLYALSDLEVLIIQNSKLKIIHDRAFRNMYQIRMLLLQGMEIQVLDPSLKLFRFLTNLQVLDLSQGKITTINQHSFLTNVPVGRGARFRVNFRENDLQCGCEVKALRDWHTDLKNKNFRIDDFTCENDKKHDLFARIRPSVFGNCSATPAVLDEPVTCKQCDDLTTNFGCSVKPTTQCPKGHHCLRRVTYNGYVGLQISSRCEKIDSCAKQAYNNKYSCQKQSNVHCVYCCTDAICPLNEPFDTDQTSDYKYILEFVSKTHKDSSTFSHSSQTSYDKWKKDIIDTLSAGLMYTHTGFRLHLDRIESRDNTSYKAVISIYVTAFSWVSQTNIRLYLTKLFDPKNAATAISRLANPTKRRWIHRIMSRNCPDTPFWPQAYPGMVVKLKCPEDEEYTYNPNKYAQRTCTTPTFTLLQWGKVTYKSCIEVYPVDFRRAALSGQSRLAQTAQNVLLYPGVLVLAILFG